MEYDLKLKHFFKNDDKLNKIQAELTLEYLNCKIEKCYSSVGTLVNNREKEKELNINKITHEDYENCKSDCKKNLNKLSLMKKITYKDFTMFYYGKFLSCSDEMDDTAYFKCIENSKKMMSESIEDIKKLLLNYNYKN